MSEFNVKFPRILQPFRCSNLVRLGKNYDGGYLVNVLDVIKSKKLISLGIGTDWSFEQGFLTIKDCDFLAYDESVKPNEEYYEFFTGNRSHVGKNIGDKSNEEKIEDVLVCENTFLKCDIEGNEYDILEKLINRSHLLSGLVIEFHSINQNINEIYNFIAKCGLNLIHVHVNNYFYFKSPELNIPDILELTFTSSDNITYDRSLELPNKLDMTNNPNDSEFQIYYN